MQATLGSDAAAPGVGQVGLAHRRSDGRARAAGGRQEQLAKDGGQALDVFIRVRPHLPREALEGAVMTVPPDNKRLLVHPPVPVAEAASGMAGASSDLTEAWSFDHVFDRHCSQEQVFSTAIAPLVDQVARGVDGAVLAYGNTGSGKTHSMQGGEGGGTHPPGGEDLMPMDGIILRTLHRLLGKVPGAFDTDTGRITVSFVEVYNEQLFDLLTDDDELDGTSGAPSAPGSAGGSQGHRSFKGSASAVAAAIALANRSASRKGRREGPFGRDDRRLRLAETRGPGGSVRTTVEGATTIPVWTLGQAAELLSAAATRCTVAETALNRASNRAHRVFTIHVSGRRGVTHLSGDLHLVDLAGSENVKRSGAEGVTATEAQQINKSLLTLGRVVAALAQNDAHVPYRDSNLTRLLSGALGGACRTAILFCVSPAEGSLSESLSTLRYAQHAMRAVNISSMPRWQQDEQVIQGLSKQLASVRSDHDAELQELVAQREAMVAERDAALAQVAAAHKAAAEAEAATAAEGRRAEKIGSLLAAALEQLEHRCSELDTSAEAAAAAASVHNGLVDDVEDLDRALGHSRTLRGVVVAAADQGVVDLVAQRDSLASALAAANARLTAAQAAEAERSTACDSEADALHAAVDAVRCETTEALASAATQTKGVGGAIGDSITALESIQRDVTAQGIALEGDLRVVGEKINLALDQLGRDASRTSDDTHTGLRGAQVEVADAAHRATVGVVGAHRAVVGVVHDLQGVVTAVSQHVAHTKAAVQAGVATVQAQLAASATATAQEGVAAADGLAAAHATIGQQASEVGSIGAALAQRQTGIAREVGAQLLTTMTAALQVAVAEAVAAATTAAAAEEGRMRSACSGVVDAVAAAEEAGTQGLQAVLRSSEAALVQVAHSTTALLPAVVEAEGAAHLAATSGVVAASEGLARHSAAVDAACTELGRGVAAAGDALAAAAEDVSGLVAGVQGGTGALGVAATGLLRGVATAGREGGQRVGASVEGVGGMLAPVAIAASAVAAPQVDTASLVDAARRVAATAKGVGVDLTTEAEPVSGAASVPGGVEERVGRLLASGGASVPGGGGASARELRRVWGHEQRIATGEEEGGAGCDFVGGWQRLPVPGAAAGPHQQQLAALQEEVNTALQRA